MNNINLRNASVKYAFVFALYFIFIITSSCIYAADDNIQFKNITISDGLSQSTIKTMYEDSKGYIWIGTLDGLNRYNGYDFKVYKHGKNSNLSIAGNDIFSIEEDSKDNIWVATISGVSKISSDGLSVTNYYADKYYGNLSNMNCNDILITNDNKVLVATSDGLNLYDEKSDSFTRILNKEDDLTCQDIFSLDQDEKNNIWIGTANGLNKIDVNKKNIKHFYSSSLVNSISDNSICEVYSDGHGYVWIGTEYGGLNKININTNKVTRYEANPKDNRCIQGDDVHSILRDKDGVIWVGTNNGLSKYISDSDSFVTYKNSVNNGYSLLDNHVISILQDSNGMMWVGTSSGISMFDPDNKFKHYNSIPDDESSLSENMICGFYEDSDGYIWVGTKNSGVNILDNSKSIYNKKVIASINKDNGLNSNTINDIVGYENHIWIGTLDGLVRIDKNSKNMKIYNEDEGLLNCKIKSLMLDSKGYLWIGTINGIYLLNLSNDEIINLSYIFYKYNITDTHVETIYETKDGNYLIGTFKSGDILKLDCNPKKVNVYKGTSKKSISTIYCFDEDEKYMWVATNYGLNRFDKKNNKLVTYTEENGLPNNNIYSVVIDDDNDAWISTNNGIAMINPESNKIVRYNITDGLQSNEFNSGAYYKNKDGYIMFGGINGLNIFNPKELKEKIENNHSKIAFEEFKINDKVYSNIESESIRSGDRLSIKFFLVNYKDVRNTKYYYKIDEIDYDWNITNSNEVVYTNLNAGNYTFSVKAVDNNGIVSDVNSIRFVVKSHILFSPLAYLIYASIIFTIVYSNKARVRKLDELVKLRTCELNEEMAKNKELYEKIIELEKGKTNYFVNLSHELRTPLNVISGTKQLLSQLNKNSNYIEKDNLDYHLNIINNNTERLLNLINNIIDTAKAEDGSYCLNLQSEDIVFVVEEICLSMKDYVESAGIELIIDPEIEEKVIEFDKQEIERCIVNLVANAKKFTPEGGKIEVKIKDLGDKVKISVSDTGIGIDEKCQKYIFNRFAQVIDENSKVKCGSGLGLTITKHIIDMHNGEIYVKSKVNEGSTFTIILPNIVRA